jgi:abortive infection bacteriophage resistance protein
MLPPYRKAHLDVPGQLALLLGRGMAAANPAKATAYLERIGYYRLSGY